MKHRFALLASCALAAVGCQDPPDPVPVRAFSASGDATFVCRGPDGEGRPLDACPDFEDGDNHLYALVTQTISGEIGIVDLTEGGLVDVDESNPGVTLLRVGQKPRDIVSTPGGVASFVGVAEVGKEGIFALPTTCVGPATEGETTPGTAARDLTTWPACALPSAPGNMAVLIDPPAADGGVRETCGGDYMAEPSEPLAAERSECRADLRKESAVPGRRKLAVAMPDIGQIWILDAQELLDRTPGSFEPCQPEVFLPLDTTLPSAPVEQPLPDDLIAPGCNEPVVSHGPRPDSFVSQPAGLALSDGTLYVADQGAPVVHVIDVEDPCAPVARPPLLPVSLTEPGRVVTTTRLAVSPLTTAGKRYMYAVDEFGASSRSLMIFDISEGATQRTPLVRPGSVFLPLEAPDRIDFAAPVDDITFGLRDLPIADPVTGVAVVGTQCDPDPDVPATDPAARYRPSSDLSRGARPGHLRGIFGFALLGSGQVAVIDVDDFDAPCRRPTETNSASELDFRGCANDPESPEFFTVDGQEGSRPTVTDEVSCRVVQPHRVRSAEFAITSPELGINAPTLNGFPRLSIDGRALPVSALTEEGRVNPKLLAVESVDPESGMPTAAQVFVGTTRFSSASSENPLVIDPAEAERASLTLPWLEPRAYPRSESVSVSYEGALRSPLETGFFMAGDEQSTLDDGSAFFCDIGVQGVELMSNYGSERFGLRGGNLERFAQQHADYVQITEPILEEDDPYWSTARGMSCGGFSVCDATFGPVDIADLESTRELRVLRAFQDRLVVEPRLDSPDGTGRLSSEDLTELIDCCFPSGLTYTVRASHHWVVRGNASGFRHRVVAERQVDADGNVTFPCVLDCNPRKRFFEGRVFEVSSTTCVAPDDPEAPAECAVGAATSDDEVCRYDAATGPVVPGGPASECIQNTLTSRFVVYRGGAPSRRGMVYTYDVTGGFRAQAISLTRNDTSVISPQTIQFVPQAQVPTRNRGILRAPLAVVDAQDRGLMMLSLDSLSVAEPFF